MHKHFKNFSGRSAILTLTISFLMLAGCGNTPAKPKLYYDEETGKPKLELIGKTAYTPNTSLKLDDDELLLKFKWKSTEFWEEFNRQINVLGNRLM